MIERRRHARSLVLDMESHEMLIDGARFPYWMSLPGPTVEVNCEYITVNIPLQVLGTVVIHDGEDRIVYDEVLGEVGEWATNYVRRGLYARLPWLEEADQP